MQPSTNTKRKCGMHVHALSLNRDAFRKKSPEASLPLLRKGDSWHLYRHCMSEQTCCNFLFYYSRISGYCLDLPPTLPLKSLQGEKGLLSANSTQKLSAPSWFLKKPFSPGCKPGSRGSRLHPQHRKAADSAEGGRAPCLDMHTTSNYLHKATENTCEFWKSQGLFP